MTDINDLLAQIRQRESNGDYSLTPQQNYAYPASHASGGYQIQPGTWRDWTTQSGIGTQYAEAYHAPPAVQDQVAAWAAQKYGPNATNTWAASAPQGGYPSATPGSGAGGGATPSTDPSHAAWNNIFAQAGVTGPQGAAGGASTPAGGSTPGLGAASNPLSTLALLQQKPQTPLLGRLLFGDGGFNGMLNRALPTPNHGLGLIGGLFGAGSTPQASTPAPSAAATPSPSTSLPTFAQGNTPPLALPSAAGGGPAGSVTAASSPLSGGAAAGGGMGGLLGQGLSALGSGMGGGLGALGGLFSMI